MARAAGRRVQEFELALEAAKAQDASDAVEGEGGYGISARFKILEEKLTAARLEWAAISEATALEKY